MLVAHQSSFKHLETPYVNSKMPLQTNHTCSRNHPVDKQDSYMGQGGLVATQPTWPVWPTLEYVTPIQHRLARCNAQEWEHYIQLANARWATHIPKKGGRGTSTKLDPLVWLSNPIDAWLIHPKLTSLD